MMKKMVIRSHVRMLTLGLMISCGSLVMGYSLVYTSMIAKQFQLYNQLQNYQLDYYLSLITSILPFGAIVGSFLYHPLCSRLGENKSLVLIDACAIVAILIQVYSLSIPSMCVSRFILGLFCGISSAITPVYLISISTSQISGILGSLHQIMITVGIAAAYGLGSIFPASNIFPQSTNQFIYLFFPVLFCLIRLGGLLLVFPFDTVERQLRNNRTQSLQQYIKFLFINGTIEEIIKIKPIQAINTQQVTQNSQTNKNIKCVVLVVVIINQFSGINAILFYVKQLFSSISSQNVNEKVFYLGLFQLLVTVVSGMLLDRVGRRTMMLTGGFIVVFSLFMGYFLDEFLHNTNLMILVVFLHIFGFSLSLGPVTMVYVAELMSNVSFAVIILWIETFFVASISQIMIVMLGTGKTFLFYGIISASCLSYLYFQMIETKGLTSKQIMNKFNKNDCKVQEQERVCLKQSIVE